MAWRNRNHEAARRPDTTFAFLSTSAALRDAVLSGPTRFRSNQDGGSGTEAGTVYIPRFVWVQDGGGTTEVRFVPRFWFGSVLDSSLKSWRPF